MLSLERFNEWYPRYREVMGKPIFQEVYRFLSSPHSIWAMAKASENSKPALTGVVKELENKFTGSFDLDNPMNRRMIGSMIKEIIHDFGFRRKGQRLVSNSSYFTTASYYELEEDKAKRKITGLFEVQNQESGEPLTEPETQSEPIISKEQVRIGGVQQARPEPIMIAPGKEVADIITRLSATIGNKNSTEQEISEAYRELFAIAGSALSALSGLFNIESGSLPISPQPPISSKSPALHAAAENLRLSGEAEVNSEEANLIIEELLKNTKDNEVLSIQKTGSTYKLSLRSKGD